MIEFALSNNLQYLLLLEQYLLLFITTLLRLGVVGLRLAEIGQRSNIKLLINTSITNWTELILGT